MPRIFEIFGYPIADRSAAAERNRKAAMCPFTGTDCDGGGNRYLSHVHVGKDAALKKYFGGKELVPSGVCSIQLHEDEAPWIVCPRRLLFLGGDGAGSQRHQGYTEEMLLKKCRYAKGTRLGVWVELKMKYSTSAKEGAKSFDYAFDYILVPVGKIAASQAAQATGQPWPKMKKEVEAAGYSLARREGEDYIEDFPIGTPTIVEIMTSSTSGGNKTNRTTIPMAFVDAVKGGEHDAPGINYRQVWARMVSQLIVKSEVGLAWGGHTLWILQDRLIDYISSSTALDVRAFLAENLSEVNIIGLSYGDAFKKKSGVIELEVGELFAGPIGPIRDSKAAKSFQDIVKAPVCPPLNVLIHLLAKRKPANVITV